MPDKTLAMHWELISIANFGALEEPLYFFTLAFGINIF